ncbi:MAG: hypothetical protein NTZ21_15365 [Actinobacteria bacterium]|nr:hypothetical protein [Actinomycetota bacterium]
MTDPTNDPRSPQPDDGFELLLRQRLHQLADHAPTTVRSLDEIRVEHHARPRARREGRHRRTAGIGATIAALAGAIGFTTVALSGAGTAGAASPEDAVRDFVAATADEDILGMIDVLDPTEVPAARQATERGRADAVEADLVSEGFSLDGLEGLDVAFADLDLVTEPLDDGLAVVTFAGGSASWTFDPAAFPLGADLREALADELAVTTDAASFAELDEPLQLATVERDGRWYVSVSYTVAEYARRASGLELPSTPLTAVGADSPEAAADEFYSNLVSLDLAGVLASAAPGEGDAVLRYAPLLLDAAGDDVGGWKSGGYALELSSASYSVEGDGDRRSIVADTFTIGGTVPEPEVYGYFDPTLPTIVYSYDGMGMAVLDAGVAVPATSDDLTFTTDFVYPDGNFNSTSENADGSLVPLPELPASDGPDALEIVRADGCTTWSGQGAVTMFGPVDMASSAGGGVTVATEAPTEVAVDAGEAGTSSTDPAAPVEVDTSVGNDVVIDTSGEASSGVSGGVSSYGGALGYERLADGSWRSCAPVVSGLSVLSLFTTSGLTSLPTIEVVEVDGSWYVSPVGTVAAVVTDLLASVRTSGSLLDSPVGWYVLGADRGSLRSMLVGAEVASLSAECGLLVVSDGTTVIDIEAELDLATVRACASGPVYNDDYFPQFESTPMIDEQVTEAVEVPASTVAP